MLIRPYSPQDKTALLRLLMLNIPQYFDISEYAYFDIYLDQYCEDYFVAQTETGIVGAGGINYFPDENTARLSWDIVHPEKHSKGIGRALVLHRLALLRQNPICHLVVVRTSQFAYRFYEKMGFILQKTEKDFWSEGYDLYLMQMPLEPSKNE